jgi:hypothetical protein
MQIEIIDPNGNVSYRRPNDHPDVTEALRTTGYSIRCVLPEPNNTISSFASFLCIDVRNHEWIYWDAARKAQVWSAGYKPLPHEFERALKWAKQPTESESIPVANPMTAAMSFLSEGIQERAVYSLERFGDAKYLFFGSTDIRPGRRIARLEIIDDEAMQDALARMNDGLVKSGDDERDEPESDATQAKVFPAVGCYAWVFPQMLLAKIIKQVDAFEWEVSQIPAKHGAIIVQTIDLDELSEAEKACMSTLEHPRCRGDDEGQCAWRRCPQIRDGEPSATGRHCPYDTRAQEELEDI